MSRDVASIRMIFYPSWPCMFIHAIVYNSSRASHHLLLITLRKLIKWGENTYRLISKFQFLFVQYVLR
jgi:hypothetical protein